MTDTEAVPGVAVWRCAACSSEFFPTRLRCAVCGSASGEEVRATSGVLTEQTVVRRAIGGELPEPVRIGTVEVDGGAVLIARVEGELADGTRVTLVDRAGAPVASAVE
jgi:uncharacterized OB-fold protein